MYLFVGGIVTGLIFMYASVLMMPNENDKETNAHHAETNRQSAKEEKVAPLGWYFMNMPITSYVAVVSGICMFVWISLYYFDVLYHRYGKPEMNRGLN